MKQTFEDYLKDLHLSDEPMTLDDDLPDAFENWLENLSQEFILKMAQNWGETEYSKGHLKGVKDITEVAS